MTDLVQIPSKLLIQVPRYGKQFKTFQRVIPDKRLDIKSLCTSDCLASSIGEIDAHLQLLSVVCIETSHYVCFTRADGRWVFMDSMADRVGESCDPVMMSRDVISLSNYRQSLQYSAV